MRVPAIALLFDCDGVLVDSDTSIERAWRQWAAEHDLDPGQVVRAVPGRRSVDTVTALVPPAGRAAALARIDGLEVEGASDVRAVPGALDLLESLPADRWAIVTSGVRPLAHARLAAAGLPLPEVLVTADAVAHGKPHPEGYLAAAQGLGQPPGACTVLEDAPDGVTAARSAGVRAVVGIGPRVLDTDADVVLADLHGVRLDGAELDLTAAQRLR